MIRVACADVSALTRSDYEALYRRATPARQARADRYRRYEDALRCVAADALLRYALGTEGYSVEKEPSGKPRIPERPDFHFNLSHAGHWVVIAWGGSPVGVDVEQWDPRTNHRAIARRYFTEGEQGYIREDTLARFYQVWTAKESIIKFWGTGLSCDLRSVDTLSPPPELYLHRLPLEAGYTLTLCSLEENDTQELVELRDL